MQPYPSLYLKKYEDRRILAGHLWIYSNEIDTKRSPLKSFSSGQTVVIHSHRDTPLAVGYVNPHTLICARVLSFNPHDVIDVNFFIHRIKKALILREQFYAKPFYRLIYAESDHLSGLIIDRFNDVFVVQTNTAGMENCQSTIIEALEKLFTPNTIVFKNMSSMRLIEHLEQTVTLAKGNLHETILEENNCLFKVPLLEGQKTGWFYDHRENRAKLCNYVKNKKVLDVFSYLGGWGIQAAVRGAKEVLCIDSSARAISNVLANAKLNHCADVVDTLEQDAFVALKNLQELNKKYDVIILDPPALIKKRKDLEQGTIAYLRLNEMAMNLLTDNGLLVSCSCSLHMTQDLLIDILRRSALKTKKHVQIIEIGHQGMDHPILPAILETAYLKALFAVVTSKEETALEL